MQLTKTEKYFTILFLIIVLLELFSESILKVLPIDFKPKPLILLSLIFFFIKQSYLLNTTTKLFMIFALVFSLTGDVLLMFVENSPNFFLGGLVSFLIAHIIYIKVFTDKKNSKNSFLGISTILLIYAIGMFYLLKKGLGDMLIPVIIYMLIILSMAIAAWIRKGAVSSLSHILVFIGAILFVVSDRSFSF